MPGIGRIGIALFALACDNLIGSGRRDRLPAAVSHLSRMFSQPFSRPANPCIARQPATHPLRRRSLLYIFTGHFRCFTIESSQSFCDAHFPGSPRAFTASALHKTALNITDIFCTNITKVGGWRAVSRKLLVTATTTNTLTPPDGHTWLKT
ncbi:hypothetical protein E2C01_001640 [Portunus trituberculatus]|uniref:Uncharacterized protein n=1 Tax=Portunus trituberculatus TaxID=210409 RepID=A0A5B7CHU3_PORTR|nr:hypothetical protein [Portunus trituberculatus]